MVKDDLDDLAKRLERTAEYLRASSEQIGSSELARMRLFEAIGSAKAELRASRAALDAIVLKLAKRAA